jgi:hypothetical protein
MVSVSTQHLEPLERWSATLLLAAGVVWVLEALSMGLRLFDVVVVPNVVIVVTALPATLLVLLAVMGFYPELAEHRPWLALAAVGLAAVALVAFAVQLVWLLGAIFAGAPNPHQLVLVGSLLVLVVSIALFAAGSVVVGVPSRTVGVLLAAFMAVWVVWLVDFFAGVVPDGPSIVFHVLFAALTLAAGYAHRTGAAPLDSGGSSPESTA